MLPTSVVILCWGILANSSRRNCLRWPRLWFGVSRTRTALPNWSRRCPMASSCLSVLCGTFIGLLDPNPCSCRRIMMVWSERRGFWTLARCDKTAPGSHSRDSGVSFCEVFFLGRPFLARSLTSPVSLYRVINLVIIDLFTPKVKATSWDNVPDWTMPMALVLSWLLNRTISWLNIWPIDHGPDRISILKLTLSNFCEPTPPLDLHKWQIYTMVYDMSRLTVVLWKYTPEHWMVQNIFWVVYIEYD